MNSDYGFPLGRLAALCWRPWTRLIRERRLLLRLSKINGRSTVLTSALTHSAPCPAGWSTEDIKFPQSGPASGNNKTNRDQGPSQRPRQGTPKQIQNQKHASTRPKPIALKAVARQAKIYKEPNKTKKLQKSDRTHSERNIYIYIYNSFDLHYCFIYLFFMCEPVCV